MTIEPYGSGKSEFGGSNGDMRIERIKGMERLCRTHENERQIYMNINVETFAFKRRATRSRY